MTERVARDSGEISLVEGLGYPMNIGGRVLPDGIGCAALGWILPPVSRGTKIGDL